MEKRPFSGRLRPDWGNTAWAATAGLGSKGLKVTLIYMLVDSQVGPRIELGTPGIQSRCSDN